MDQILIKTKVFEFLNVEYMFRKVDFSFMGGKTNGLYWTHSSNRDGAAAIDDCTEPCNILRDELLKRGGIRSIKIQ